MLTTNKDLFPDRRFITECAMDLMNYVYSKVIVMVFEGSL